MRRTLRGPVHDFVILTSQDIPSKKEVEFIPFPDHFGAEQFLRRLISSDDSNTRVLRDVLAEDMMMCMMVSDDDLIDQLATGMVSGHIRIADKDLLYLAESFKNINDVIGFIHKEMIRNEKGRDVAYIRGNLGIWQWDNLIPGKYGLDVIQAYWRWYEKVKGGGPWDHKKVIKESYGEWSCDFPKRTLYNFDVWSNVHYGYIGLAANFDEWVLLSGAGTAQKLAGTDPPGYWKRRLQSIGDADFLAAFDDPNDQEAIRVGFELWKNFKTKISAQNILEAVRNHSSKLTTKQVN